MNATQEYITTATTVTKSKKGYHELDTTTDMILGIVLLILAIILTFICCVTLAVKCSKEHRAEYRAPVKLTKIPSNDEERTV